MRETPKMTLSSVGKAPPAKEVPDPRGTTGISWAKQIFITAATSSVVLGRATIIGDMV